MFSKGFELIGLGMIALGLAMYLSAPAGIIFGGASLVLIGTATDDAAITASLRRGSYYLRYLWHRQILRENGVDLPDLSRPQLPVGWTPCDCGLQEGCPVCGGLGYVPDPTYQENTRSPHPAIKVDPQTEAFWGRMARARQERSKLRDRTQALSRYESEEE